MTKHIFVLEDNIERINWFKKEFSDCDITITTEADDGVEKVKKERYDLMFLDFDLGGMIFVSPSNPNTGLAVARTIPYTVNKHTPVIIHSWNAVGTYHIKKVLSHGVSIPFGQFTRKDIKFKEEK